MPLRAASLALVVVLIPVSLSVSPAQVPGTKPRAPLIPSEAAATERAALVSCAMLLSRGQFSEVVAGLRPLAVPAVVRVFVDWAPVPGYLRTGYRQAARNAVGAWNAALAGSPRVMLVPTEDADLRVFFEQAVTQPGVAQAQLLCCDTRLTMLPTGTAAAAAPSGAVGGEPLAVRREAVSRISLYVPYSAGPHPPASVAHLVSQAVGGYLGLGPSTDASSVMGPDSHERPAASGPSQQDVRGARALLSVRTQLAELARRHVAAYLPRPVLVVETPELDGGDVQRGDPANYVFRLRNTGDAPLEIDAKPNCGCTVASFDKTIAPGAQGKVSAEFHTAGYRGKVTKLIDVTSNDPERPSTSLRLLANVLSAVEVLPGETVIVPLRASEPTVKEFDIRTRAGANVEITKATPTTPYVSTELTPLQAPTAGGRAYKLLVTIGPAAPAGRTAFAVTVATSSPKEPLLTLTVICDKGILAIPQTLFMGAIGPSTVVPLTQIVTLSKSDGAFRVVRVSSDDPLLAVQPMAVKEGSQYQLRVTYKGGWRGGAVRSRLIVETDDTGQPRIEVPVMATVLPGAK